MELLDELRRVVGDDACLSAPEALFAYECDGLTLHSGRPLAVVLPRTAEQVQEVVRACRAAGVTFVPRGAGTGLSGGATAREGSVVIECSRLDRILEAEGDNTDNYKLSKQADVLMLPYLFSDRELQRMFDRLGYEYDADATRRNFEYYDPITTGDSSLSACVQSIVAADVGRPDAALDYFHRALYLDFDDSHGNTSDGDYCDSTCLAVTGQCGDGLLQSNEACDDGQNDARYGGCASDCLAAASHCGDGVVDPSEACDDGVNDGSYSGCNPDCTLASRCGDGLVDEDSEIYALVPAIDEPPASTWVVDPDEPGPDGPPAARSTPSTRSTSSCACGAWASISSPTSRSSARRAASAVAASRARISSISASTWSRCTAPASPSWTGCAICAIRATTRAFANS